MLEMYDPFKKCPEDVDSSRGPPTAEDSTPENPRTRKKENKKSPSKGFSSKDEFKEKRGKAKKKKETHWFKEKRSWAEYIKKHRADLKKAKPVVDDLPPKLNVSYIYDMEILRGIRSGLKGAFDLSQAMVKRLHEVNLLPGKTDTFKFKYDQLETTNYNIRRDTAKKIEKQNLAISKLIKNSKTRMKTAKIYAEEWAEHEAFMDNASQFPLFWKVKKRKVDVVEVAPPPAYFKQYVTEKSARFADKRPRVFLEISIRNVGVVGKMVALLYSDYVPMTVKNFLAFCDPKASLTYKGNSFYLIFQDYYCQTGDVIDNRGYGGTSIYGPYFGNEDCTLKHGERGVLTMYQKVPNRNGSQFLITFSKLESLDGQNVAFGKIIRGIHVLDAIESIGSKKTGRPKVEIYISDCDEI